MSHNSIKYLIKEVLMMKRKSKIQNFYGPLIIFLLSHPLKAMEAPKEADPVFNQVSLLATAASLPHGSAADSALNKEILPSYKLARTDRRSDLGLTSMVLVSSRTRPRQVIISHGIKESEGILTKESRERFLNFFKQVNALGNTDPSASWEEWKVKAIKYGAQGQAQIGASHPLDNLASFALRIPLSEPQKLERSFLYALQTHLKARFALLEGIRPGIMKGQYYDTKNNLEKIQTLINSQNFWNDYVLISQTKKNLEIIDRALECQVWTTGWGQGGLFLN